MTWIWQQTQTPSRSKSSYNVDTIKPQKPLHPPSDPTRLRHRRPSHRFLRRDTQGMVVQHPRRHRRRRSVVPIPIDSAPHACPLTPSAAFSHRLPLHPPPLNPHHHHPPPKLKPLFRHREILHHPPRTARSPRPSPVDCRRGVDATPKSGM